MADFKLTRFELETKGLTLTTEESHVIIVLTARSKRILVEDAFFHTDSSMFLPTDPRAGAGGIVETREFSNDAFWDALRKNNSTYVEAAKESDFVPPDDDDGGGSGGGGGHPSPAGGLDFMS